jgi:hypothetical protein
MNKNNICPSCKTVNPLNAEFCQECGVNLKLLGKLSNINKRAIIIGIITWIPIFLLWAFIGGKLIMAQIISAGDYAYSLVIVQFINSFITGYVANRAYVSSATINGLIVAIIYSVLFIILGGVLTVFISIIIFGGLGGGFGGYLRIKRNYSQIWGG